MWILLFLAISLSFGTELDELIKTAIKNNPDLKAMRKEAETFKGLKISASAMPNPEVNLEINNTVYLFELSQEIPIWGTREKGRAVFETLSKSFESRIRMKEREIAGEVYRAYYRTLFLKKVVDIRKESLQVAKDVLDFVSKSHQLGETTLLDLMRARRELDVAKAELDVAYANYKASLRELSIIVGKHIEEIEGDYKTVREIKDIEPEQIPLIMAIGKEIESINKQIMLEKALALPTPRAGFVVEDSEEGFYAVRGLLSFDVPVFYRRKGEIIEAEARKRTLRVLKDGEIFRVKQRLSSIKLRYEVLKKTLMELETKTIPVAEEELKLAIKSYRLRSISLLELSNIKRGYYDLLTRKAEILMDLHSLYAEFVSIGGWQ